ncbi:SNAP receptor [Aureococcus anophagefferens]|nr:SNAP receptor [Aureococcus anophagefferens]
MIVYAVVARRTAVLAEFTMTSGNFPSVTRVLLSKITDKDSKMSYVYDQHVFHYVTCEGITYLCMADQGSKRRRQMHFYNSDPSSDELAKVKTQLDDVRHVMVENVEKVLERGEKIELLVDKTDRLTQQAFKFENTSKQPASMGKLDGKVCIVTGASSGIGLAVATALAGEGAKVVMVSRSMTKEKADVVAGDTVAVACDAVPRSTYI